MPILEVNNLSRGFGGIVAVDGLNMSISGGEITGIIGPNGSGKSTTFNLLSGVLEPDNGSIHFKGENITNKPPHEIARLGIGRTFQLARVFDDMTVLENLMVVETDSNKHEKAMEILNLVELEKDRNTFARNLSGGQQVLLGIARVLMLDPELLLLDEPFAGVNPGLVADIRNLLTELSKNQNKTIVIIDHEIDELSKICNEIFVLVDGKKLLKDNPSNVRKNEQVHKSYLGGI